MSQQSGKHKQATATGTNPVRFVHHAACNGRREIVGVGDGGDIDVVVIAEVGVNSDPHCTAFADLGGQQWHRGTGICSRTGVVSQKNQSGVDNSRRS